MLDGLLKQVYLFYDFTNINYEDIDKYVLSADEYRLRNPAKEYISLDEHNAIVNEYQNRINELSSARGWLKNRLK